MCLAPEAAAPAVMGHYEDPSGTNRRSHCFYKRQPQTTAELDEAVLAMEISCIENLRYGGTDPEILKRLRDRGLSHLCDALEEKG